MTDISEDGQGRVDLAAIAATDDRDKRKAETRHRLARERTGDMIRRNDSELCEYKPRL